MYGVAERSQKGLERFIVLVRQNFSRRHDTCLVTVVNRQEATHQCDKCLTRTDIALQQAVHLFARFEVVVYLVNDAFLCVRQLKRQRFVQGMKACSDHGHRETGVLFPPLHLLENLQLEEE